MSIRVCVVDDDPELRIGLCASLSGFDDVQCIGTFENAEDFSAAFMDLDVSVVLMDINMPGNGGIQTVAKWKPRRPEVQFMMVTIYEDNDKIFDALCAGATGYLVKSSPTQELVNSIREIQRGGSPMSASVARRVVESFQQRKTNASDIEQLNSREWEILTLLDKGFRYKEISDQLSLSFETIRTYVRNIYDKLQVHSRIDALNKVFPKR